MGKNPKSTCANMKQGGFNTIDALLLLFISVVVVFFLLLLLFFVVVVFSYSYRSIIFILFYFL